MERVSSICRKGCSVDYSQIIKKLKIKPIRELSNKKESVILTALREDGNLSVVRIYDSEQRAYQMIAGKDIPGLPRVYDCGFAEGYFFAEEEYIDGISLQEMIDGGARMDEARAAAMISSVCETLSALHALGIIHRDIKPEHVILTPEGTLYLIDLDAAMQLAPDKEKDTRLLGTAIYAAPEQFGLTRSDVRTDIFAVGILLNMLLTGAHPTVRHYNDGDLAAIISKCTRMNPASRYQNTEELLFDLNHAVLMEKKEKRRRLYKIAGGITASILLVLGILLFDILYYPTVEMKNFEPSDKNCLVCTKTSWNTYTPLKVPFMEESGAEAPAQIYLGENEDRTFYILSRSNADRLDLPILDCYREETGEKLDAKIVKKDTVKMGNTAYYAWKVEIDRDFEGASRVGLAFDGTLASYHFGGEDDAVKTKFLWILDEACEEDSFLAEHDGNIIPCDKNISGEKYNSTGGLSASEAVLGAEKNELLTKHINLSLEPGDEENAFYLIHPAGTEIRSVSYRVHAFGLDSSGYGSEGAGGRFREKLDGEIYALRDAGRVMIAGQERQVTRAALKQYPGHQEIETTFELVKAGSGSTVEGFAGIRLVMGLNLVLEAESGKLPNAEIAGINSVSSLQEKALGFEPETKPLVFAKNAAGSRYEAFLPEACAMISDEGQGRLFSVSASVQNGWTISDITDKNGNPLAYTEEKIEEYILLDETGSPVYDAGEIYARGWRYGMSGTSVSGSENRTMLDCSICVKSRKEDYAKDFRLQEAGNGSREVFERFLQGKDRNGNPRKVRKCLEYTNYIIWLDPARDMEQNEVILKLEGTAG